MKKFMLGVATVATLAWTTAATAQPYGYYPRDYDRDYYGDRYDRYAYRDSDRDGTPDRVERGRDVDCDGRPDQYDRYWNRGLCDRYVRHHYRYHLYGPGYGYNGYRGSWRVGERYPYWRSDRYVVYDYRTYGLPPPRHGYRYYRTDSGDIVMVAIASGLIGLIAGQALADNYR